MEVSKVLHLIKVNKPIVGIHFDYNFNFRELLSENVEVINKSVIFENCSFEQVTAFFITFKQKVIFKNCCIKSMLIQSCFFEKEFFLEKNSFQGKVSIESCGFFYETIFSENSFEKFINFNDCNFKSLVRIQRNKFTVGTNLLNPFMIPASSTFESKPVLENNTGLPRWHVSEEE